MLILSNEEVLGDGLVPDIRKQRLTKKHKSKENDIFQGSACTKSGAPTTKIEMKPKQTTQQGESIEHLILPISTLM